MDLSYEMVEETETYPIEEMINELVGIFGLYFGFSVISMTPLFQLAWRKFWRKLSARKTNVALKYV